MTISIKNINMEEPLEEKQPEGKQPEGKPNEVVEHGVAEQENCETQKKDWVFFLTEEIDMDALRLIRDNFKFIFETFYKGKMKVFNDMTGGYEETTDFKTAETVVNNLYTSKERTNKVNYEFTPKKITYGRRFHRVPSLQECPRQVRHTISKNIYWDIDIKNAHPIFLWEYVKKIDFYHPVLELYINNREPFLQKLIDEGHFQNRDEAKAYILSMINGGGKRNHQNNDLKTFYSNHQEFLNKFFTNKNNSKYKSRAETKMKSKNSKAEAENKKTQERENLKKVFQNEKGIALNYYLCEIENIVLGHIEDFLTEKGIQYGTLCFDGLMVYKKDLKEEDLKDFLIELEDYVEKQMKYRLTICEKPMEEFINLEGLEKKPDIDTSDEGYGGLIYSYLKDSIKYNPKTKDFYKYNDEVHLWKKMDMDCLILFISNLLFDYINMSPNPELIKIELSRIRSSTEQTKILKQIKSHIRLRDDSEFIVNHFNNKKGVFPLKDGKLIDFRTGEVRERVKEDYFTKETERSFVNLTEETHNFIRDYYISVLTTIDGVKPRPEYVDCLCSVMAYMMTGENNLKKFVNLIGDTGDNGKSVFLEHHREIFDFFSVSGNKRSFLSQNSSSSHDAETVALIGSRMVILSELGRSDKFNEELIKAISGGDTQSLRGCGEKETNNYLFQCILIIATNIMAMFDGSVFKERLLCVKFNNKFSKNPDYVDKIKSMKDEFFSYLCSYAKTYYDNNRQITFVDEIIDFTNQVKLEGDSFQQWIKDTQPYEPTDVENSYIIRTDAYELYKLYIKEEHLLDVGRNIFYIKFEKHYNVIVKEKRIQQSFNPTENKKTRVYYGLIDNQ